MTKNALTIWTLFIDSLWMESSAPNRVISKTRAAYFIVLHLYTRLHKLLRAYEKAAMPRNPPLYD